MKQDDVMSSLSKTKSQNGKNIANKEKGKCKQNKKKLFSLLRIKLPAQMVVDR